LVKNDVDKYIAFGGLYEYVCFVDKNGNVFLQKYHNKCVNIGRLYGKYLMFVEDQNLIIAQKGKIYRINIINDTLIEIECPMNIMQIQGFVLDDYIWSKNEHKFLNDNDKKIIESFILCNKHKGKFKINYYVLSLIFTYYLNTKLFK